MHSRLPYLVRLAKAIRERVELILYFQLDDAP